MSAARTTGAATRPAARFTAGPAARWPGPAVFVTVGVVLLVVAPLALSPFRLDLLAKYLCYAIVAVGIYLAWGRGGMLTLGQGVFFGLGGYAMGMYLKLSDAGEGNLPDFMVWSGVETLPAIWAPFRNPFFALAMVVVLPTAVALILGTLVFRQRVRGAYFAVLSQALAAAFVILLVGQQGLTGGTNGLTNVQFFFGLDLYDPTQKRIVYYVCVGALGLVFLAAWQLTHSRFGKLLVAIRDGEDRVRFLGYDPAVVKTLVYALSAAMAGIAGALFVPVVGILGPADLGVVPSIEMLVAVAIGGRFSLVGAVGGAILFNYGSTVLSEQWPSGWLYLLGGLFIAVMMWAPRGLAGLLADGWSAVRHRWPGRPTGDPPGAAPVSPAAGDPVTPAQTQPAATASVGGDQR
ncbi:MULTISPECIES: urea ABC transporter permease subunit UrtC [unclassified Solwaraspora]|uniref:urea ABC transporter permease subunit UrtC n=1 Tax=unclassified Solwaraspora TaxID=2627926 RepID=UPI00259BEF6D|nr:urea ABC transporter permease subunit UrtC [Solwaraspora sp. WMMA2056]WJK39345.1 urea ABC transporter permease subunit UrtC [Solwaraspora sp. WMMA2056]